MVIQRSELQFWDCPDMWGSCHLPVSYFLYLRKSYPAHMACSCAEAEHMHKGSTQDLCRRRNSIYLSQIRATAPLSSHRHKQFFHQPSHWAQTQISLPSLHGKRTEILVAAQQTLRLSLRVPPPPQQMLTNACLHHLPPQTSVFISFVAREEFVPRRQHSKTTKPPLCFHRFRRFKTRVWNFIEAKTSHSSSRT